MATWYLYGVTYFTTEQKRTNAAKRLDARASKAGFTPQLWDMLAGQGFVAGKADVTDPENGQPGLQFCYATTSEEAANEAISEVGNLFDINQDSNSWYGWTMVL